MLGRKIRLLRQRRGWKQDEVAKKLAISVPAFSKIEAGITDMNFSRLEQLAALFDLSIVQLLALNDLGETIASEGEIAAINKKLGEREAEIIELQKKVIELFDELMKSEK